MLLQFTFSNFASILEPVTLSMTEANITEFSSSLLKSPEDNLGILPLALIYGPNGGGKSNVLKAFSYLAKTVKESLKDKIHFQKSKVDHQLPSTFDITFRLKDREFNYQLSIQAQEVLEETLFARRLSEDTFDVVFDRDNEGIYLAPTLESLDVTDLNDDTTMLSFIKDKKISKEISLATAWLSSLEIKNFYDFTKESFAISYYENSYRTKILKFFNEINIPLADITIQDKELVLSYKNGFSIPAKEESRGVHAIFSMLCYYYQCTKNGKMLLLDDLSGNLHPKALEHFLKLFREDANKTQLQCIASSNSMPAMHNTILRRDEIYLCAQDNKEASKLYSLAFYIKKNGEKVRKDEVYYKQYLEGRYGSTLIL